MQELNVTVLAELNAMYKDARAKVDVGDMEGGLRVAESAWARLPEPKFDWDASKIHAHALAALYRDSGRFDQAVALMKELFASGTVKSYQAEPYFILGTIYYEKGDMSNAQKWLKDADKISKGRCFQGKPEKYKQAISKNLKPV